MLILFTHMLGHTDYLHSSLSSRFTWQKTPQGQLVVSILKTAALHWECVLFLLIQQNLIDYKGENTCF